MPPVFTGGCVQEGRMTTLSLGSFTAYKCGWGDTYQLRTRTKRDVPAFTQPASMRARPGTESRTFGPSERRCWGPCG